MDDRDMDLIIFIGELQGDPDRMREAFDRTKDRLREEMPELYREFTGRLRDVVAVAMQELGAPQAVRDTLRAKMKRWGLDA